MGPPPNISEADCLPFPGISKFGTLLDALPAPELSHFISLYISSELRQNGLLWRGGNFLGPFNASLIQRELLSRCTADKLKQTVSGKLSQNEHASFKKVVRMLNGALGDFDPTVAAGGAQSRISRSLLQIAWSCYLLQHRHMYRQKNSMGRAQLIFQDLWKTLFNTELTRAGRLPQAASSQVLSLEASALLSPARRYCFYLGLVFSNGYLRDMKSAFQHTVFSQEDLAALGRAYSSPFSDYIGRISSLGPYPNEQRDSLLYQPILDLGPDLICPCPHLLFTNWDYRVRNSARSLFDRHLAGSNRDFDTFFGTLFDEYVYTILHDTEGSIGESILREFTFSRNGQTVRSPDLFIVRATGAPSVILELKSATFRSSFSLKPELDDLFEWTRRVLGAKKAEDIPLERQGTAFLEDWKAGNPEIVQQLGEYTENFLYCVVSYGRPPGLMNTSEFKSAFQSSVQLPLAQRLLLTKTVFLGSLDVETLSGYAYAAAQAGYSVPPLKDLLADYLAYNEQRQHDDPEHRQLPYTLSDYLVYRDPKLASTLPPRLQTAFVEAFQEVKLLAPKNPKPQNPP